MEEYGLLVALPDPGPNLHLSPAATGRSLPGSLLPQTLRGSPSSRGPRSNSQVWHRSPLVPVRQALPLSHCLLRLAHATPQSASCYSSPLPSMAVMLLVPRLSHLAQLSKCLPLSHIVLEASPTPDLCPLSELEDYAPPPYAGVDAGLPTAPRACWEQSPCLHRTAVLSGNTRLSKE